MYTEDDLLPISALQHLLFCERQCALIHIDRIWEENVLTVQGRLLHDKAHGRGRGPRGGGLVDQRFTETGGLAQIRRGMRLRSLRLGLAGVADVVEIHTHDANGTTLNPPRSVPVEYKRGRAKRGGCDRVQLCAQALCLEEMTGSSVSTGAIFYGQPRRRQEITFDVELRHRTEQGVGRLHQLIAQGVTPTAPRQPKCKRCSLRAHCMPDATHTRSASGYLRRSVQHVIAGQLAMEADE